ncbi:MAG: type II toxin-antitoxin system RelE/ParE family toxin [Oceanospirillaceae bacterium]|nr:type II toxin-antitoxin system RelE/ParE family toxin [Oceanospirillaceae bacterium]
MNLVFKETDIFTKLITQLLSDDEYKELQEHLIERPDVGAVIEGTGGLRKVRWAAKGGGKSGGVRIIYYWITEDHQIYMLLAYPKSKQDNLTATQKKVLKALVHRELQEKDNG